MADCAQGIYSPQITFQKACVRRRLYAHSVPDTAHISGYLTSGSHALSSQPSNSDSLDTSFQRKNVSGFKIMTITRGFTEEADKLLNYMVSLAVLACALLHSQRPGKRNFRRLAEELLAQLCVCYIFSMFISSTMASPAENISFRMTKTRTSACRDSWLMGYYRLRG